MNDKVYDVIVVGAGLAGASALTLLSELGINAVLVEARDRAGGRAYSRPFNERKATISDELLEYGGAWIMPEHDRVRVLAQRHGFELRPRQKVTARHWLRDGAIHSDGPVDPKELTAHERAIARIATDTVLYKSGYTHDEKGRPLLATSFEDYLESLDMPKGTRNVMSAWWAVSGAGEKQYIEAGEFLSSCAHAGGLAEGMIDTWVETVSPGMSLLAERMIKAAKVPQILSAPVLTVAQAPSGVLLTLENRETVRGRSAILALGINQTRCLEFRPLLSRDKSAALETGHGGRAFKIWAKMEGVPVGTLVTGDGRGVELAYAERESEDGTCLIVGFGVLSGDAAPEDGDWVRGEFEKLFPNARYVASDWHDWLEDPFALGTWLSAFVGTGAGLDSANWRMEGCLAFASSDIAREHAGWFEGALLAGEDAAYEVAAYLAARR